MAVMLPVATLHYSADPPTLLKATTKQPFPGQCNAFFQDP